MNPALRVVDRLRPVIIAGALGLHAVAALAMPEFVAQVNRIVDRATFVQVEAITAPTPVAEASPVEPVRERPSLRAPREVPVAAATPVMPAVAEVAETPPVETTPGPAPAPSDPLTATGGAVSVATTGQVGSSSGNGTATTGSAVAAGPVVDRRALLRSYRGQVAAAIGRMPPLRGTREQIDAVVIVGMHIAADGRLSDVRVVRTSGHPTVDAHVLDYFRGLRRLPAPPSELELDGREFTYQVRVGT